MSPPRYPNIDRLDTLTFGGLKNGVQTLRHLLKKLGNPQDSFHVLHVAGTNGKGSVCQMLSQVLRKEFGYQVGLTISPHLVELNERIQINGEYISHPQLDQLLEKVFQLAKTEGVSLSFFESMILAAILFFAEQKVDYAVIEVGLGGKYDATNIFHHPVATLITTISDDHLHLLGPSLTQVFRNKAGIMKAGVTCFTRLDTPLVHRASKIKKAPLVVVEEIVETNLLGAHQRENAGLAYRCLRSLGLDEGKIRHGLQQIEHAGRCQRLRPNLLVDGAHNREGVVAFAAYVESIRGRFKKLITIFGCTKTYADYPDFFAQLIVGEENYLVKPAIEHRAVDPLTYRKNLSFPTTIVTDLPALLRQLDSTPPDTLIIVYGSLYLVGEVIETYAREK